MSYQEILNEELQKDLQRYEELKAEYEKAITSEEYSKIRTTIRYDLVKAKYLISNLNIGNNNEYFSFHSEIEAERLYSDLLNFKKQCSDILEKAKCIDNIRNLSDEINEIINNNPCLNKNLLVYKDTQLEQIAKECSEVIPTYHKRLNLRFRNNFIKSCLISLNEKELTYLIKKNIIKGEILSKLPTDIGNENYKKNYDYVLYATGLEVESEKIITTLKGVTFNNEDGTNRQDIIDRLKNKFKENKNTNLKVEKITYTDPKTNITSPAYRVLWENNCIGMLSAYLAKEISTDYADRDIIANIKKIKGDFNKRTGSFLGCDISLELNKCKEKSYAKKSDIDII